MIPANEQLESILADLRRLRGAYAQRGLLGGTVGTAPVPLARDLYLADALLRNVVGRGLASNPSDGESSDVPSPLPASPVPHVAVFGGTQVGKSTIVNVLAGRDVARVHHTAGYTRHAQGFAPPGLPPQQALAHCPQAFLGFDLVPREVLSMERPLEFSLENLSAETALPGTTLWDTPDCDAVDSGQYQQGFVEAITVADVVVYVTSREKYAVNAILQWVARLRAAGCPLVAVLNLTPSDQQAELLTDMTAALDRVAGTENLPGADVAAAPALPAVALPYVSDGDVSLLYDSTFAPAGQLRQHATHLAAERGTRLPERKDAALRWIEHALPGLLEQALDDLEAWKEWNARLDVGLEGFVSDYRRFYLDDPNRYDAFNRVGLEILKLLDPPVPGLRKALSAVRAVVSLPARALLAGGRAAYRFATTGAVAQRPTDKVPREVTTYQEAHNRLLNDLARFAAEKQRANDTRGRAFWVQLNDGWTRQVPVVEQEFRDALDEHRARTQQWIREAAQGIYNELAREPVKLNLLRTGRLAADAGAIVVSMKSGGAGDVVHDLVVAPALMSVVEAISRQLAGSYVDQKKTELRERLVEDTRTFAESVYGTRLRQWAADSLGSTGLTHDDGLALQTLPQRVNDLRKTLAKGGANA